MDEPRPAQFLTPAQSAQSGSHRSEGTSVSVQELFNSSPSYAPQGYGPPSHAPPGHAPHGRGHVPSSHAPPGTRPAGLGRARAATSKAAANVNREMPGQVDAGRAMEAAFEALSKSDASNTHMEQHTARWRGRGRGRGQGQGQGPGRAAVASDEPSAASGGRNRGGRRGSGQGRGESSGPGAHRRYAPS